MAPRDSGANLPGTPGAGTSPPDSAVPSQSQDPVHPDPPDPPLSIRITGNRRRQANATDPYQPPDVDICILRHLPGTSNVVAPDDSGGKVIMEMSKEEVVEWCNNPVHPLLRGEFSFDGLTADGIALTEPLRQAFAKLLGIDSVISSPLTRAIQTATGVFPKKVIESHDDFQEATIWPHDAPPVTYLQGGKAVTTYIMLKGGDGPDRGQPVRRQTVVMEDILYRHEKPPCQTRDARIEEILTRPTQSDIEARALRAREFIHDVAVEVERTHKLSGRKTTPKIVVVSHGGFMNFLTGDFHGAFTRPDEQSDWQYVKSSALNNGDTVVYRFQPDGDNIYNLVEKPRTAEYEEALGNKYRVIHEEKQEMRNPDGTLVDQKAHYMRFNERVARDVAEANDRNPLVFRYLCGLPGPTIDGEMSQVWHKMQRNRNNLPPPSGGA